MESPFLVLTEIVQILEQQKIPYALVGSLASSMYGMYRSTADIDLLADIKLNQVGPLVEAMKNNFYVDEKVITEAIQQRRSFNAIHFDSVFKIDVFIPKADEFSRSQLERRQLRKIAPDIAQLIYVATAEDTILAKLRWYREGGEVSNNQWFDVQHILGVSDFELDFNYLREWADKLALRDLLERAISSVKDRQEERS